MINRSEDISEYNAMRSEELETDVECDTCPWSGSRHELVVDNHNDIEWLLCPQCGNPPMSVN